MKIKDLNGYELEIADSTWDSGEVEVTFYHGVEPQDTLTFNREDLALFLRKCAEELEK